jgi:hypothetical protein
MRYPQFVNLENLQLIDRSLIVFRCFADRSRVMRYVSRAEIGQFDLHDKRFSQISKVRSGHVHLTLHCAGRTINDSFDDEVRHYASLGQSEQSRHLGAINGRPRTCSELCRTCRERDPNRIRTGVTAVRGQREAHWSAHPF